MMPARPVILIVIAISLTVSSLGQNAELKLRNSTDPVYHFSPKKLIIPTALIAYGIAGLAVQPIKNLNLDIRSEITGWGGSKCKIDNLTLFAPAGLAYGLNLVGIKGKHDFLDRSIILATSMLVTEGIIQSIKYFANEERPDGSNFYSFPSNHTAIAFAGAEFLYQEYKDVSVWYGVAGYTIAAGTGFLRMYNNRHWFTDVVAGAGFGIVSTKVAYWVFPKIKRRFFKDMQISVSMVPCFDYHYGPVQ